jgi:recombinational DNA repair protein (RecF pathway)
VNFPTFGKQKNLSHANQSINQSMQSVSSSVDGYSTVAHSYHVDMEARNSKTTAIALLQFKHLYCIGIQDSANDCVHCASTQLTVNTDTVKQAR